MRVRRYRDSDRSEWQRMSEALFPDAPTDEYDDDIRALLARDDAAVFIAERPDGSACGFVEVGARSVVDGCRTSPVGYIEAWYVDPDVRRAGYGRALIAAAEEWAREQGYQEMGSDALIENDISVEAHQRIGYTVVDRVVTMRKSLV